MPLINFDPDDIPEDGRQLGEEGMRQVIENTDDLWKERFTQALLRRAATGQGFTSEDVTEDIGGLPHEGGSLGNNVVGALMNAAAKRGEIRKTGRHLVSQSPRAHGREIREWIGA